MTRISWVALGVAMLIGAQTVNAQSFSEAGFDSDRVTTTGPNGTADLYGSGNDDTFQSYGIVSFNMTAADFGVGTVTDIQNVVLNLTFNDRFFSDGTQFEMLFTADDFDDAYTGLSYDDSGVNDPSGIDAAQFTSLTTLGVYDVGFDMTDDTLGGTSFAYTLDVSAVQAELIGEINAGSDFSLILAAVDNADDITFSGVGNTFDPGDPVLAIGIPEPSSAAVLGLIGFAGFCRRRR